MTFACIAALALAAAQENAEEQGRLHPFILKALSSPYAIKSNSFVSADGKIVRSSVHVKREGLPDWVHQMADEKLGKGEDVEYEVEVYPDGSQVYEVYREIDGLLKQLSVKPDRTVYYTGTEHSKESLPEAVSSGLATLKGFKVRRCVEKSGPTFFEYHVKGKMDGTEYRARIGKDGRLIALQRVIPGAIELESRPGE